MNPNKDIRWIQRFQNFDRAFLLLRSALEERGLEQMSDLEKEGLIQRFEYSYELAWKTMKDYLEEHGTNINPATPRQCDQRSIFSKNYYGWPSMGGYAAAPQFTFPHL